MRADFDAATASADEVAACIRHTQGASGYLLDPHTACGVVAAEKILATGKAPNIVLATAHPAKFPDAIEAISGARRHPAATPRHTADGPGAHHCVAQ